MDRRNGDLRDAEDRALARWGHLPAEELAARSAWHELAGVVLSAVGRFCERRARAHGALHEQIDTARYARRST